MIFDMHGFPKDKGATDYMDSARLAGLMAMFGLIDGYKLEFYVKYVNGEYVGMRHPYEGANPGEMPSNNPKNFTRDQLMCLVSGLDISGYSGTARKLLHAAEARGCRAQNTEADYPGTVKKFPNGADLLPPSAMNHLRICAREESTLLGRLWLKFDIMYNGKFSPLGEPNQLICMCMSAGPEYVRMWKNWNPQWKQAITTYWCGWRQESELAEKMIKVLEAYG